MMRGTKLMLEIAGLLASAMVFATGMIRQFSNEGSPLTLAIIFSSGVNLIKGVNNIITPEDNQVHPIENVQINNVDIEQGNGTFFRDMVSNSRVNQSIQR